MCIIESRNNNFLIFVPLLLLATSSQKNVSGTSKKENVDSSISNFITNVVSSLTVDDINQSVDTLKKIGPYLPDPYVDKVNSFVFNFEKINKVNELATFLTAKKPENFNVSTQNISSKEKFNKILLTLKDDMPEEKIRNIRPIIDVVANFDKYKSVLKMVSTMNNPSEKSEDKMDSMINMVMPLLGQNGESADKMKDMLQIFKTIASSSGDQSEGENQDYQTQNS